MSQNSTNIFSIEKKKIANFLNSDVKDYAKYVIETRTMPSIMDGLRVGARKIIYAALTGDLNKSKMIKLPALIGDTMKLDYHHGDASLMNTITQLAREDVFRLNPLTIIGQIGTLRIPKCDTAPRYLHVKQSPYIKTIFYQDRELLEILESEGEKNEPKFFLPIIPIQLLIRTSNPGFGFSFKAFSYDVNDVIDNCIESILQGTCQNSEYLLKPYICGIDTNSWIYNNNKQAWYSVGDYIINLETDTLIIKDLPYSVTFEKFEEHLFDLKEKFVIYEFTDLSIDGKIEYHIKFPKNKLAVLYQQKWKFFSLMKLYTKVPTDILNCIDEDGKTILFIESPYKLIDIFVEKRLKYYDKRKTKTIKVLEEEYSKLEMTKTFINLVITNKLIINKRSIQDIKKDLERLSIDEDVLKLNISRLTVDEIKKLDNKISETLGMLDYIKNTSIQEMYIKDLISLKDELKLINKII